MIEMATGRARLETERARLLLEIRKQYRWCRDLPSNGGDVADQAANNVERARCLAVGSVMKRQLTEVEEAMRRCDRGVYGVCKRCGGDIDPARLDALPSAACCLKCQQRLQLAA